MKIQQASYNFFTVDILTCHSRGTQVIITLLSCTPFTGSSYWECSVTWYSGTMEWKSESIKVISYTCMFPTVMSPNVCSKTLLCM